jgi:hypothetical protein
MVDTVTQVLEYHANEIVDADCGRFAVLLTMTTFHAVWAQDKVSNCVHAA